MTWFSCVSFYARVPFLTKNKEQSVSSIPPWFLPSFCRYKLAYSSNYSHILDPMVKNNYQLFMIERLIMAGAKTFIRTFKEDDTDLSLTDDPKKNTKIWQKPVYTDDEEKSWGLAQVISLKKISWRDLFVHVNANQQKALWLLIEKLSWWRRGGCLANVVNVWYKLWSSLLNFANWHSCYCPHLFFLFSSHPPILLLILWPILFLFCFCVFF